MMMDTIFVWQAKAAAVILVTLCATALLRRAPARLRRAVLGWGMLVALVVPLLGGTLVEGFAVSAESFDLPSVAIGSDAAAGALPLVAASAEAVASAAPSRSFSWAELLMGLWLGGVFVGALWLVVGVVGGRLIRRQTVAPSERLVALHRDACRQIGVQTSLRVHPRPLVPLVFGVFRPVVVLPQAAESWSDSRVEAVLLHELGHVAHGDHRWFPLLASIRVLLWIDPLAWLLLHRFRHQAEFAADDAAVTHGMRPSSYAAELLELARVPLHGLTTIGAPGLGHPHLGLRIRRVLMTEAGLIRLRRVVPLALGALGAVVGIALVGSAEPTALDSEPVTAIEAELGLVLPSVDRQTSVIPIEKGPRISVTRDEMRLTLDGSAVDLRLPMNAGRLPAEAVDNHLVGALYDLLSKHEADDSTPMVVWADAQIRWSTLVNLLYTAGRAGIRRYAFAVRVGEEIRAIDLAPPTFRAGDSANETMGLHVHWDRGGRFHMGLGSMTGMGDEGLGCSVERDDIETLSAIAERACEVSKGNPISLVLAPSPQAPLREIAAAVSHLQRTCGGGVVVMAGDVEYDGSAPACDLRHFGVD